MSTSNSEMEELERMMSSMATADAASTELMQDGEIEPEELMPDLEEFPETVEPLESSVEGEEGSDVKTDYDIARQSIHWLLKANQTMIVNNARIAKTTMHPKNFEAHDKLVQTQLKLADSLIGLTGKLSEGKLKARASNTAPVFEGQPTDANGNVIDGESNEVQDVRLTRRPSQSSVWEVVSFSREREQNGEKPLGNDEIQRLALALDEKRAAEEDDDNIVDVEVGDDN